VFPRVPVRQWVPSFPWPLRLLFAARPDLLSRVLGVANRGLSSAVKRRAGHRVGAGAETGIVTFIQRFGSALRLERLLGGAFTHWESAALSRRTRQAVVGGSARFASSPYPM
jgi:hypothetical protein